MAKKLRTILIDDLDGSEAQTSIEFALDGTTYEVDLNHEHAEEFTNFLGRYIAAGRKVTKTRRATRRSTSSGLSSEELQRIRDWATHERGYNVSPRGRIKQTIIDEYNAVHGH